MIFRNNTYKNVSHKPFRYLKLSIITESCFILGVLMLHVLMLVLTKTFSALTVVFSAVLASCLAELLHSRLKRKDFFTWIIAVIHGMLIGLLLPQTYPPFAVFWVVLCVLLVNTFLLGGFANSWINPVCAAVVICWILGMNFFPGLSISLADLQTKNPALILIQNGTIPISSVDPKITAFLNSKIFGMLGVSIPEGYVSMLWDSHSIIPAFRFNFITLFSSLILFSADIFGFLVPAFFIFTYGFFVKFVAPFFYGGILFSGDLILALLTSGILFCTLFVIQWPGTVPMTNRGKIIYGTFAGVLAFFLVGSGTSSIGAVFTILTINLISLIIQSVENNYHKNYATTVLYPRVKAVEEGIDA